jgi:hypothetical protein
MSLPVKLTEKRPIFKQSFEPFGVGVSVSVTQNQRLAPGPDEEIAFISGDDLQGVESTLWRKQLSPRTALKLGGPSVALDASSNSLSTRILGIGASHERVAQDGVNNVQISAELKVTHKTVAELAGLAAPAALAGAHTLFAPAAVAAGEVLQHSMNALLPGISAALAARSVANAVDVIDEPSSSTGDKFFAVGRAIGDVVRVFDLGVGTAISACVSVVSAFVGWWKARRAIKALTAPE